MFLVTQLSIDTGLFSISELKQIELGLRMDLFGVFVC